MQFNQAGFRQKEVRLALDTAMEKPEGEIFIIPARLAECDTLQSLRRWHWVDLFEEDGYEKLLHALRTRADKIGATLHIRKGRTPKIRKPHEVITTEKDTNNSEPNISSKSVSRASTLDKIEKDEIKECRLPDSETPIARKNVTQPDGEDISLSESSAKQEFSESEEQPFPKRPKDKRPTKTGYIVAIFSAGAIIIVAMISNLPQIFKSLPELTATIDTQVPLSTYTALISSPTPAPTLLPTETIEPTAVVYDPHPDPSDYIDPKGVPMRPVSAGEFTMGSDSGKSDERPVHTVGLDAYYIDKYEVTNRLYKVCVDADVCQVPQDDSFTTDYYGNPDFDDYPVMGVSWEMAKVYCEWRGAQLPTEAQWEKAARGLDERTYPWGEGIDQSLANYDRTGIEPAVVGTYEKGKSPYGVYDMAGNVWEWVADWYSSTFYDNSPTFNPSGPGNGQQRVLRGGVWYYGEDRVRVSSRDSYDPVKILGSFGFRCARDATP
jgi:formylglycine-generating enzyme required for sulfatase activity